jgi:hypothetical protein
MGEVYQVNADGHRQQIGEVEALRVHPSYSGSAEADLVVVKLDARALAPTSCAFLIEPPVLSESEQMWAVGHGQNLSKEAETPRAKRLGLLAQSHTTLTLANLDDEPVCLGDSGGPVFATDQQSLLGVISRGAHGDCRSELLVTRLNQEKRAFIRSAVSEMEKQSSCADCRKVAGDSGECQEIRSACQREAGCRVALACSETCTEADCSRGCLSTSPMAQRETRCGCVACSKACSEHWRCESR